jgi:hypothetical protein
MAVVEPAVDDFVLWRGNNAPPRLWEMADDEGAFPLLGSVFVLTVAVRGVPLFEKRSDVPGSGLVVDVAGSTVTWTPSAAESRQIPTGRLATYELERRIGAGADEEQETWIVGAITGRGGLNDD